LRHKRKHQHPRENIETQTNITTQEATLKHERKGTSRHQSGGRDLREDIERWKTAFQCYDVATRSSNASETYCCDME